jgi:predicted MFS family arabinose efflux permease
MIDGADATNLRRTVPALGVAQIISWGTLFYAIGVLGAPMRDALGTSDVTLFGSFTCGLFASGIVSPWIGRRIDAHGGRGVLAGGSVLGALACAALALAPNALVMFAGWLTAGIAMAACLYDPAFATLHRVAGASYRRVVTALTLFGGFASTVFWPLSQYLLDAVGWRAAFAIYAGLHALVCLPLHLTFAPGGDARVAPRPEPRAHASAVQDVPRAASHRVFAWLAVALALATFVSSALSAHLIGLMTFSGLTARDAVLIGSLIGPMQVAGRIMEFAFNRHIRALAVGTLAFALLALSLAILSQVHGVWIVALAFAICYGWSNGVMTIVRGTAPAELFGHHGYGALLGRLAQPQFVAKAAAPLVLTLVFTIDPSRVVTLATLVVCGVVALYAYQRAIRAP